METGTFLEPWLAPFASWLYTDSWWWTVFGLAGNALFSSRFLYQWLHSERRGELLIPPAFWHLSFWGGLVQLIYALHTDKLPVILGSLFLPLIYGRNLVLLRRTQRPKPLPPADSLEGRVFAAIENTPNGDADAGTRFHYHQQGNVVWAEYSGEKILRGQLLGQADDDGSLSLAYQHLAGERSPRTGICKSTPERLPDGRLRFHEEWQTTSGDRSRGRSTIEEVRA
jgi:lipid-A-disaccharide synthase-like uncharacterized protein